MDNVYSSKFSCTTQIRHSKESQIPLYQLFNQTFSAFLFFVKSEKYYLHFISVAY